MIPFRLKPDPLRLEKYLENYSHFLLKLNPEGKPLSSSEIKYKMEMGLQGFKGLIFYIYLNKLDYVKFDLLDYRDKQIHYLEDIIFEKEQYRDTVLSFIVIPFGYFEDDNRITIKMFSDELLSNFKLFTWTPSYLFKHVKSIIKVKNEYIELVHKTDFRGIYFKIESWFKANENKFLLSIVNLISNMDDFCETSDIKMLITKANEYLFDIGEEDHLTNILKDLKELIDNSSDLSKELIVDEIRRINSVYKKEL